MILCDFSGYSCSSFMVSLSRRHFISSLDNYISKFISNLFVVASGVDFVHISIFALSFWSSETCCFIIETILILVRQRQYFVISPFYHLLEFFLVPTWFRLRLMQKRNLIFQISFWCSCIPPHLSNLCIILYLYFF